MNPHYTFVAGRAGHRCEYCQAPEAIFNFPFEVEHVIPRSSAGADSDDNRALAGRSCNLRKLDRVSFVLADAACEVRLFHPRTDAWAEHFLVEKDTCRIVGISAVGKATVACLEMNSEAQVATRLQWARLGLFP